MSNIPQSVVTQAAPPDSDAPPQTPTFCAFCGEPLTGSTRFCPRCGQRQTPPANAGVTNPQQIPNQVPEANEPANESTVPPNPMKQSLTLKAPPAQAQLPASTTPEQTPPPPPPPSFRLARILPNQDPLVAELDGPTISIGKAADCNLTIEDDPYISRHHTKLTLDKGVLFLEDMTSSNGTLLRVKRRLPLEVGDEFIIGNTTLRLEKA